jgi:hypothetical protein
VNVAVDVELGDELLSVQFTGVDRGLAVTRGIDVSLAHVVDARAEIVDQPSWLTPMVRVGTFWPGVVVAGRYKLGGQWELWGVRRHRRLLVVDLTGERFNRLVLQVSDPDAHAERITTAVSA